VGYGLSHRESAKNTGVSPTTAPNLEAGKVSEAQRRTTRKLAQALGVDPAELVGDYPLHLVKVSHHAQYLELSRTREILSDSVFTKSNLFDTIFP
jgi:transcriptional regulator with XRE-family HTH domain